MADLDPTRWKEITPEWWGVIAAAAGGAAMVFAAHRVAAGIAAAGAAFALALYQLPCCAGCAPGATCQDTTGGATAGTGKVGINPMPLPMTGAGELDPSAILDNAGVVSRNGACA